MDTPVSVVIPAYNHEQYIHDCVLSVVNQSMSPSEILIIDDGSTDRTGDICRELAKEFPLIRFIDQENRGAHNALNRGISEATGDFIAILNSDDLFLPDKLETYSHVVSAHPDTEFIMNWVSFIDTNGQALTEGPEINWYQAALAFHDWSKLLDLSLLYRNFAVTTSNMFFSKRVWQETGGFQPLRYCHDLEFILAASRITDIQVRKDRPLIRYRVHPANTIKENRQRVRTEMAGVLAQAIAEPQSHLLDLDNPESVAIFGKFIRGLKLSDITLYLLLRYQQAKDKAAYYEYLSSSDAVELRTLLTD